MEEKTEEKKEEVRSDAHENHEHHETEKDKEVKEEKIKKEIKKKPKSEAVVNSFNAHLSAKTSAAVCRFIKNKNIDKAIEDLEDVIAQKKAVPMKGEIPHRKGKNMMAGRYPKNAAEHFIKLLKTLAGNSNVNGIEEPIIVRAIANIGERPYGQLGAIKRKRTHIKIISKSKAKKEIKEKEINNEKELKSHARHDYRDKLMTKKEVIT